MIFTLVGFVLRPTRRYGVTVDRDESIDLATAAFAPDIAGAGLVAPQEARVLPAGSSDPTLFRISASNGRSNRHDVGDWGSDSSFRETMGRFPNGL
jgi:hypothetical protein